MAQQGSDHDSSLDSRTLLLVMLRFYVFCLDCSGVTTRGEVRQLPQGAKRQGALGGAFDRRIVCFALQNSDEFLKRERS